MPIGQYLHTMKDSLHRYAALEASISRFFPGNQ